MIKNILPAQRALHIMLVLISIVLAFHFLVLLSIIPYDIVWAGKLKSKNEMYVFEAISISVNVLLIMVLLVKGNYIRHRIPEKIINGIVWLFILLFALNTFGNLMATTLFEKVVFTPLTFLSTILLLIIACRKSEFTP